MAHYQGMPPKFISVIYFEGAVLAFTEWGDVYRYTPQLREWAIISYSPWPQPTPPKRTQACCG